MSEGEEVTMVDVLESQKAFEEDADAVLGGSDDKRCTYDEGYVKRQALYACLSCCPAGGDRRAGICLACSLHCHDRHELVELYTKRSFRCDCGGPSFPERPCSFSREPRAANGANRYDHNFAGTYCTCRRPYPDPEAAEDRAMIQCVVCEDWLHADHLGVDPPDNDAYAEMICPACTDRLPFLAAYARPPPDDSADAPSKRARRDCTRPPPPSDPPKEIATFWPQEWRADLCRCAECVADYDAAGAAFLLDADDTVTAYETLGDRPAPASQYEKGLEALSSLDRVQQINAIAGYNHMKEKLLEFLRAFKERKEVVREEDIKDFFAAMKPDRDASGVYFCR